MNMYILIKNIVFSALPIHKCMYNDGKYTKGFGGDDVSKKELRR